MDELQVCHREDTNTGTGRQKLTQMEHVVQGVSESKHDRNHVVNGLLAACLDILLVVLVLCLLLHIQHKLPFQPLALCALNF